MKSKSIVTNPYFDSYKGCSHARNNGDYIRDLSITQDASRSIKASCERLWDLAEENGIEVKREMIITQAQAKRLIYGLISKFNELGIDYHTEGRIKCSECKHFSQKFRSSGKCKLRGINCQLSGGCSRGEKNE